jgi:hypothetical protein
MCVITLHDLEKEAHKRDGNTRCCLTPAVNLLLFLKGKKEPFVVSQKED